MGLISHFRDQKKRRKGLGSVGDTPPFTFFCAYVCLFAGRTRLVFVQRRLLIQVVRDFLPPFGGWTCPLLIPDDGNVPFQTSQY